MKNVGVALIFIILMPIGAAFASVKPDLWALFSKTRFVEKLNRQLSMYFLYPAFPPELEALEGKEVELTGFHIPLEVTHANMLILSKYPMAECFFCGGAGPESVAVVYLREKPAKRLKMDDILTVKGNLELNENDVEELNFIIKDAHILQIER
jgi:uncharacterized membrane protein YcgQ (UPF0703/DUF1980 family)